MSVLIKGLDMPETEYMDIRIYRDGTAVIAIGKKPYYREFETVEVPTPHGDLIDRKVMRDTLMYEMVGTGYQTKAMMACDKYYIPTVIEAEE